MGYLPFHDKAEGLVGAFHQADCLLSVTTQGNFVDVDELVSHLETHSCCLAAFLNLEQKCSRWRGREFKTVFTKISKERD